jgi:CDP-glucose 4,6-dehydratase
VLLAERLLEDPAASPDALNFGPATETVCTVAQLVERVHVALGGAPPWQAGPPPDLHETPVLRLSSRLATKTLGWRPRLELDAAVAWTADWHLAAEQGADIAGLCRRQLADFEHLAA